MHLTTESEALLAKGIRQLAAYNSKTDPEAAYVWRWIGMHAPDLVIELMAGDEIRWRVNSKANDRLVRMAGRLNHVLAFDPDDSLTATHDHTAE